MSPTLSSQSIEMLNVLSDQFGKLEGGSMDIGGFRDWFRSLRWDSSKGFNTTEMAPLGWAIETSLFEYDEYPDAVTVDDLRECIALVMNRQGLGSYAPLFVSRNRDTELSSEAIGVHAVEDSVMTDPSSRVPGYAFTTAEKVLQRYRAFGAGVNPRVA